MVPLGGHDCTKVGNRMQGKKLQLHESGRRILKMKKVNAQTVSRWRIPVSLAA